MPETAPEILLKTSHSIKVRVLEPERVKLERIDSGFPNLIIEGEACYPRIKIVRCFPLSGKLIYVSFRDWDDEEIGLVENVSFLDRPSRKIVQEELEKRYFVSEITEVYRVRHQYGFITFEVDTNRGQRTFHVQDRHRNIVHMGRGRLFIVDIDGCQYDIRNYRRLSNRAQGQLFRIL